MSIYKCQNCGKEATKQCPCKSPLASYCSPECQLDHWTEVHYSQCVLNNKSDMNNKIFNINIEQETLENTNYRRVIYTDDNIQIVLMSLEPGEYIDWEQHSASQFFRFERGKGQVQYIYDTIDVKDGIVVVVPKLTYHCVENISKTESLKLYTIYSPPQHDEGTIDKRMPIVTKNNMTL